MNAFINMWIIFKRKIHGVIAIGITVAFFTVGCGGMEEGPYPPGGWNGGKSDYVPTAYRIPSKDEIPILASPEIIVSLNKYDENGNTVALDFRKPTIHLFDRITGYSRVFPAGIGAPSSENSSGSNTPIGYFYFGSEIDAEEVMDANNFAYRYWYYPARPNEIYQGHVNNFEGYPFMRLSGPFDNIEYDDEKKPQNNDPPKGYAFHGPITNPLKVGWVSQGCVRMRHQDIVDLFYTIIGPIEDTDGDGIPELVEDGAYSHPHTPIAIQLERELDATGNPVTFGEGDTPEAAGSKVVLWAEGDNIKFGDSIASSFSGFIGDSCTQDSDCGGYAGAVEPRCHPSGFCTQTCEGYCPDKEGYSGTFCTEDKDINKGICVSRASVQNDQCNLVPGTEAKEVPRFVGNSGASEIWAVVCVPTD